MDSYIKFTDGYVCLGAETLSRLKNEIYTEILLPVSQSEGGVHIEFQKLNDEIFEKYSRLFDEPESYGDEGYLIDIKERVIVYYTAEISKIFALYAIRRHCSREGIRCGVIYNTPKVPFRCALTHLPGKKVIPEYKKFIDMLLAFGHNTLMVEVHGAMEYKRHMEISEGWVEYCKFFKDYNKKNYGKSNQINKIYKFPKNSIGIENGDGEYLSQEELKDIVEYCKKRHMEIIPNVPSFSHADYILYAHPELAEYPDEPLPSNICPSNEDYYKLIFDIIDEVIEVFNPKRINIGHDEAYVYGQCPKCKGKSPEELFGGHIVRLHDYIAEKGIKTMMWGDGILPTWHGGNAAVHRRLPWDGKTTFTYKDKTYPVRAFECNSLEEWEKIIAEEPDAEGWFVPEKYKSIELVPNDLQVMNWSWSGPKGENNEKVLAEKGLFNVYGNFFAIGIKDFDRRIKNGVSGVSYSAWSKSDLESLQRSGAFFGIAYNAYACWNRAFDDNKLQDNTFKVSELVYKYVNDDVLMKKHLEITHTTTARIEHPVFCDGYDVVRDDYIIGNYEVLYSDGTTENIPICWGYNIGSRNVIWDNAMADASLSDEEGGYSPKYRYEPMGTSKISFEGGKTNYMFVMPIDKDVKSVTVNPCEGFTVKLIDWRVVE